MVLSVRSIFPELINWVLDSKTLENFAEFLSEYSKHFEKVI